MAEAWTLLGTDVAALRVCERKVLCKILGPVRVGDDFRTLYDSEMYELLISSGCTAKLCNSGCILMIVVLIKSKVVSSAQILRTLLYNVMRNEATTIHVHQHK